MTSPAVLTLIATILAVEAGVVEVDLGRDAGLVPGDRGMIRHEFAFGDEVKALEIGPASVIEASADRAKLAFAPALEVRAGFHVRFEIASGGAPFEALEETEVAIRQLLLEIRNHQAALDEAERDRAQLARRVLDGTAGELESRLAGAEADLEENRSASEALSQRIEELSQSRGDLERKLDEALANQLDLETAHAQASAELTDTKAELDRMNSERSRLESSLKSSKSDYLLETQELERVREELSATLSRLAQAEAVGTAAKEALRSEIQSNESTLAGLTGNLELREIELVKAQARLSAVESERGAAIERLNELDPEETSRLERELAEARRALEESARQKKMLEVRLAESGRELTQAEAKSAILQAEIDRVAASVPRQPDEVDQSQTALDESRRYAAELEAEPPPPAAPNGSAVTGSAIIVLDSAVPCLNFRAEPKADSRAFDCLLPGTRLVPLGTWEDWHYVELADGSAGWVWSQHVGALHPGGGGL